MATCQVQLRRITSNSQNTLKFFCKLTTWELGQCLYSDSSWMYKEKEHAVWTRMRARCRTCTHVYSANILFEAHLKENNKVPLLGCHYKLDHHVIWWLGLCGQAVSEAEAYYRAGNRSQPPHPPPPPPLPCVVSPGPPSFFSNLAKWVCTEQCVVVLCYPCKTAFAGLKMGNLLTTRIPMIALCFE